MENKISVVINTYNEEASLPEILEHVKGFDEILVCDMESTDSTVKIAEEAGCRVVTFPKGNINIVEPARDFAIHEAAHEWVLVVDADEIVTDELKKYLYDYIKNPKCADALLIPRKNYVMNIFMRNSYPDHQLRFMRKDKAQWPARIHVKPVIDGRIEKVPSENQELALIHKSITVQTKLAKMNTYTTNEVAKRKDEKVNLAGMFLKPTFRFVRHYFFKGGIFHGMSGLLLAINEANYKFYTLVKIWEARNEGKGE